MVVVIGILIGLAVGAGVAFLSLYAFAGSRLAAARRTRQLLITEAKPDRLLTCFDLSLALERIGLLLRLGDEQLSGAARSGQA